MKKAFSLVELMIIIIAISVILSAFVPMITKKLKMNDQSIGAGGAVSETVVAETICTLLHGENCIDCTKEACTSCSITWPGCTQCTIEGCTNCLEGCTLQNKSCSCPPPTLSKQDTWFTKQTTISKDSVSSIEFVHAYKPTGSEHFSWNASDDDTIQAVAYAVSQDDGSYKIIINDNYSGKIYANENMHNAFASFKNVKLISFFDGFDTSNITTAYRMFYKTGLNPTESFEIVGIDNWNTSKVNNMNGMLILQVKLPLIGLLVIFLIGIHQK